MTDRLDHAVARVRALSPEVQDECAGVLMRLVGEEEPAHRLSPEEEASLARSRAQAARREFAADETVRAIWSKHGL